MTTPASHEQRVAAAIAVAIALARNEPAPTGTARVDGAPQDGAPSAWRAVMGPGTARLAAGGGRR